MSALEKPFLILFFLLTAFVYSNAQAQTAPKPQVLTSFVLSNDTVRETLDDGPVYIVSDRDRNLGFQDIIARIPNKGLAKNIATEEVISLGTGNNPFWMVIPVTNKSDKDIWVVNFGNSSTGRMGYVDKAIIYEPTSGQTILNTTQPEKSAQELSNDLPVRLLKNTTSYLIFYLEGHPGNLTTLNPTISPGVQKASKGITSNINAKGFIVVSVLILLMGFGIKRDYSFIALSVLWLSFFIQYDAFDNFFLIDTFWGAHSALLQRLLLPFLLLLSFWLTSGIREKYPPALIIGITVLFAVAAGLSVILPPVAPAIGIIFSYTPAIGISLIIAMMTWPHFSLKFGSASSGMAILSSVIFCSNLLYLAGNLDLIHTNTVLAIYIPWVISAIAPLVSLMQVSQSTQHVIYEERENIFVEGVEDKNIREARESSELKRLLKVLEQEREQMKELRNQGLVHAEEMKATRESMEEANRAKSAFLAVVSHEIRTPMTGVMGMVRLLLDSSGLTRDQKDYLNTIQDSGEALLSLLNDILDFEKIESGKLELENVSFDMRRLLKGVHTLMGGHAASKNVTLQLAVDNNVPDFLIGDPTRLRQVLLNLVNNAIKFTSQGNVVLQVKNLSEGDMNPSKPKQIYFAVQDSGIGISAEAQKKIFTPFSQADSSINRKFGGTGLGLTICKRLIEAMGSSIGINSREGEGSTFFFTLSLPVAGAQDISIRVPVAHDDKGRKLKVLVVDDNGINQKVLTGLLGKNGHHASLASNADEAVVKATSQQFDLILMDIELPGKSGIHATQEIRAYSKKEIAHTPIVAMTGNVSSEDRRQYINVGMNDMLGKPVMPDSLQKVLNKTMSGEYETRSAPAQPSYVPLRPSPFAAQPIPQTPPEAIAPQPVQNAVRAPISADEYIPSPPVPLEEFIHQTSAGKDAKPGTVPSSEVTSSDWQNVDMDDEEDSFSSAVRAIEQEENDRQLSTDTKISDNGTLDENLIASLIKSLGAGQTKDLLKDFYEKTEELIMQINEAFKAQDPVNIKARAHELKGMAANFGFKSLGQTAGIIEKDVMNAKHAELVGMIESLQGLYTQSRAEMDARLA